MQYHKIKKSIIILLAIFQGVLGMESTSNSSNPQKKSVTIYSESQIASMPGKPNNEGREAQNVIRTKVIKDEKILLLRLTHRNPKTSHQYGFPQDNKRIKGQVGFQTIYCNDNSIFWMIAKEEIMTKSQERIYLDSLKEVNLFNTIKDYYTSTHDHESTQTPRKPQELLKYIEFISHENKNLAYKIIIKDNTYVIIAPENKMYLVPEDKKINNSMIPKQLTQSYIKQPKDNYSVIIGPENKIHLAAEDEKINHSMISKQLIQLSIEQQQDKSITDSIIQNPSSPSGLEEHKKSQ